MEKYLVIISLVLLTLCGCKSQSYMPEVENPQFSKGEGPVVFIDEAHNNFHTADGKYRPFAELLREDGYVVKPFRNSFKLSYLRKGNILVISNALNERNKGMNNWSLPAPSALTEEEIAVVRDWIKEGGALLLIADHMPFPGAVKDLASVFGVKLANNYAWNKQREIRAEFKRSNGALKEHPITNGRTDAEKIDSVVTYRGHAFQVEAGIDPLLVFGLEFYADEPETAGKFKTLQPDIPIAGWLQGAALHFGRGRVAIFGEAAMFTVQRDDYGNLTGLGDTGAEQNTQFVLNVLHWLSGVLEPKDQT